MFRAVGYKRTYEVCGFLGMTEVGDAKKGKEEQEGGVAKKTVYELWVDETRRRMDRYSVGMNDNSN